MEERLTALEAAIGHLQASVKSLMEMLEGEADMRTRIDDRLGERLSEARSQAYRDHESLKNEIYHVERLAENAQRAAENAEQSAQSAQSAADRAGRSW